jgi:outer membrane lipoprotein SlyB
MEFPMKKQLFLTTALLTAMAPVFAQDMTPKQQYQLDLKNAAVRYADDKKLCAEETDSGSRMQCLRDAKAEYTKAQANAKSALNQVKPVSTHAACTDCGKVVAVNLSEKDGEGSALGVVAGGVVGGLLGNQVGNGNGRDLATLAGAAGGAFAGHKIEQKAKATKVWQVSVQYDNGNKQSFNFDHDPGMAVGDLVKNSGNSIVKR